jgi:protein-S-isoprenylcysteine O-methyltransferase Ste14
MSAAEPGWKLVLRVASWLATMGAFSGLAVRAGWTRAAWFSGLMFATMAVNVAVLAVVNPRVLRARAGRMRIEYREEKRFAVLAYTSMISMVLIAILDARFGWSALDHRSLWAGAALHSVALAPMLWAMAVNPWAERNVRIQRDRGQQVVRSGPYRFVRHPMYLGLLVMVAAWPLLLGSLWAYLAWGLSAAAVARRALFEDNLLRRELPGYEEYTRTTRYRIVPGVW